MRAKGQGLGKERERSLQDIRDVFGFATKTRSLFGDGGRVEGREGMLGGKKILAKRSHLRGSARHPV